MDLKFEKFFTDYSLDMKFLIGRLTHNRDPRYIEDKPSRKRSSQVSRKSEKHSKPKVSHVVTVKRDESYDMNATYMPVDAHTASKHSKYNINNVSYLSINEENQGDMLSEKQEDDVLFLSKSSNENRIYANDDEFIYFEAYAEVNEEENEETPSESEFPHRKQHHSHHQEQLEVLDSPSNSQSHQVVYRRAPKSVYAEKFKRFNKVPRYIRVKKHQQGSMTKSKAKTKRILKFDEELVVLTTATPPVTIATPSQDILQLHAECPTKNGLSCETPNEPFQCSIILDEHENENKESSATADSDKSLKKQ